MKVSGQNLAHAVMVELFDLYTLRFYRHFIELKFNAEYFTNLFSTFIINTCNIYVPTKRLCNLDFISLKQLMELN